MKNYFYKLNRKYISTFSNNVLSRFRKEDIKSDASFIKLILKEINNLFQHIGGRVSNKSDIPSSNDFPESSKFNNLIRGISYDLDKLYTSQKLIEDDLNNLVNFNASQRAKTYKNLVLSQQKVYSVYIKNKNDIRGEIIIPSDTPFNSPDAMSNESEGVKIERGVLTLDYKESISRDVDINGVRMFFSNSKPQSPVYPSTDNMGLGSHWKIPGKPTPHHIDNSNLSQEINYKKMLIDDPNNNYGIGFCEFEGVQTSLRYHPSVNIIKSKDRISDADGGRLHIQSVGAHTETVEENAIKEIIGQEDNKDSHLIYMDIPNSLQGEYIKMDSSPFIRLPGQIPQYKLIIPFTSSAPFTNTISLSLEPNALGFYPKINWKKSKVYSNSGGSYIPYDILEPTKVADKQEDGIYKIVIRNGFIKPSRMEIILEYGGNEVHWSHIGFMMSHWVYSMSNNYTLPVISEGSSNITLILNKSYDIYVDSEPNINKEKQRAINVLLARGK